MRKTNINPFNKKRAQKILAKIETGNFDENDIYNILMTLREYSKKEEHPIFREIADFVAHNDERDKGIIVEHVEKMYLKHRYSLDYTLKNKTLNIIHPFPIYVKKLIENLIDECNEAELKKNCNMSKQLLKSRINTLFHEDKENKTLSMKEQKTDDNALKIVNALNYLINLMHLRHNPNESIFNQDQLIVEFIKVLKANDLEVKDNEVIKYADKITVCIILLLHFTKFKMKGFKSAFCLISHENNFISYDQRVNDKEPLGNLFISVVIQLDWDGNDYLFAYNVITTNASAKDWCNEDLFFNDRVNENDPNILRKMMVTDKFFHFTENGKIGIISS